MIAPRVLLALVVLAGIAPLVNFEPQAAPAERTEPVRVQLGTPPGAPAGPEGGPLYPFSRQDAIDIVMNDVILPSPYLSKLVAQFHLYASSFDSVLQAGQAVAPFDSAWVGEADGPTYFFWLDNEPDKEFFHSTTFAFVDAQTGFLQVFEAESWPVVDAEPVFFDDAESIYNVYENCEELVPEFPLQGGGNTNSWALVVVGKNGGRNPAAREAEKRGRKNDLERIKEILNGVPGGPQVPGGNITILTGADTLGATMEDLCAALDSLGNLPGDCGKFYFWYLGHGSSSSIITADDKTKYEDLICKLDSLNADEVCIVIEACHSGGIIDHVNDKDLKGVAITSSEKSGTTSRLSCGTPFHISLLDCMKDPLADGNQDGKVDLLEAAAWAAANDPIVQSDEPQGAIMGGEDDGDVGIEIDDGRKRDTRASGNPRRYRIRKTSYVLPDSAFGGGDSTVCRYFLYVENLDTEHAINDPYKVIIECDDAPVGTVQVKVPKAFKLKRADNDQEIGVRGRTCLLELPDRCRDLRVRRLNEAPGVRGLANQAADGTVFEHRERIYAPGEFVFEEFAISEPAGQSFTALVDDPLGWGLWTDPVFFFTHPLLDPQYVFTRGYVPGGATSGGEFTVSVFADAAPDTATLLISARVDHTPAGALAGGQVHGYREINATGGMGVVAGLLRVEHSVIRFPDGTAASSVAPGELSFEQVGVRPETGSYSFSVSGEIDWTAVQFSRPFDGVGLNGASGSVFEGGVHQSLGDGLVLSGDLGSLYLGDQRLTENAGDALVLDGAQNVLVHLARIEGSGGNDVTLRNSSDAELRDCYYDLAKESVEGGSTLRRTWTTPYFFESPAGDPLYGVVAEIYDDGGTLVASDTSDAGGFAGQPVLEEYVQAGLTRTDLNPHTVLVSWAGGDTAIVYSAVEPGPVVFVLDPGQIGIGDGGLPARLTLAHTPNPVQAAATIRFALPEAVRAVLRVYDARGRLVDTVVDDVLPAGRHERVWTPEGRAGGMYFYRLQAGGETVSGKMLVTW